MYAHILSEPGTTIACSPNSPQRSSCCLHPQTAQDIWPPSWQVLTKTANLRSKRVVLLHNDLLYHPSYLRRRRLFSLDVLCLGQEIYFGFGSRYLVYLYVAVVFNNMDALGCARGRTKRCTLHTTFRPYLSPGIASLVSKPRLFIVSRRRSKKDLDACFCVQKYSTYFT